MWPESVVANHFEVLLSQLAQVVDRLDAKLAHKFVVCIKEAGRLEHAADADLLVLGGGAVGREVAFEGVLKAVHVALGIYHLHRPQELALVARPQSRVEGGPDVAENEVAWVVLGLGLLGDVES